MCVNISHKGTLINCHQLLSTVDLVKAVCTGAKMFNYAFTLFGENCLLIFFFTINGTKFNSVAFLFYYFLFIF